MMAAALQHVQETDHVALHVHMRILGGVAHARLRGKVDHALRLMGGKYLLHRRAVRQIRGDMGVPRHIHQPRQSRLLQGDIVVVIEIVEADDLVAARQQALGDVGADEAGGASNEDFHIGPCSIFWMGRHP